MKKEKFCKHCGELFTPRRKNHLYCSASCKTLASYKRNKYKYNPGHYVRDNTIKKVQETGLSLPVDLENQLAKLTDKIDTLSANNKGESINTGSVTNAAIGTASANIITFGLQKIIAPQTLPATKKDISELRKELGQLKQLLYHFNLKTKKSDNLLF